MAIIIKQIKEINFSVIKDGILCTIFCEYSTSDAPNCGGWFHKIFPRGTNEVKILLEEVIQNPKFLGRQVDFFAAHRYPAFLGVQNDVLEAQNRLLRLVLSMVMPTQQCPTASD